MACSTTFSSRILYVFASTENSISVSRPHALAQITWLHAKQHLHLRHEAGDVFVIDRERACLLIDVSHDADAAVEALLNLCHDQGRSPELPRRRKIVGRESAAHARSKSQRRRDHEDFSAEF